jgi:hypothetical protein
MPGAARVTVTVTVTIIIMIMIIGASDAARRGGAAGLAAVTVPARGSDRHVMIIMMILTQAH